MNNIDDTQVQKRKRGRPRKIKIIEPSPSPSYNSNDFLKELEHEQNNTVEHTVNEEIASPVPSPPLLQRQNAQTFTTTQYNDIYEDSDYDFQSLYSEKGAVILGKNKRELLCKIKQYKKLFSTELKSFKVNKNATEKQLEEYLEEMESIVSTSSVEGFVTNSILQCIKVIEGVSSRTENYDITGTAEVLQRNPEFNKLTKILMIKYKVFGQIPPEYQLIFIISTTAMVMRHKNKQEKSNL